MAKAKVIAKIQKHVRAMEVAKHVDDDSLLASCSGDVQWLEKSVRNIAGERTFAVTKKDGFGAIHLAAMNGHLEILKILVEKQHAPVDMESECGWRAVHLSINKKTKSKAFKCLTYLLEHGADPSKPNRNGFTPIHQAAYIGHVNCLKALISAGAVINTQDADDLLPVDYARICGHRMCVRILNDRQWHIDKDLELCCRIKAREEDRQLQMEIENINIEEKMKNIERCKSVFEEWLGGKGLSNTLKQYEPFSVKVRDQNIATTRLNKRQSPKLPKAFPTASVVINTPAEPEAKSACHYIDEFEEEKKLHLIPLGISSPKRKQRVQNNVKGTM